MSKIHTTLANTFDVIDAVATREIVTDNLSEAPVDATVEADADAVRDTLYNLLKKGEEAFEDLKRIAVAEESPRSFEVLNSMLGQLSDIAGKIMDVHEKKAKISKTKPTEQSASAINTGTVNNTTVFVGTTADLQDMIKKLTNEGK